MTPDEPEPSPADEASIARMMAIDAMMHGETRDLDRSTSLSPASTTDDELARGRLMLLLRMIEAAEAPIDPAEADAETEVASGELDPVGDGDRAFLGRFEFLEDLGAGGFGFVVRARDRVLGREVALKMPLPERLIAAGNLRRFLREARAAARLDHPNIVRVHDAGAIGTLGYFIASEFCPGSSLRRWLSEHPEPVPPRLAAQWAAALADGVQHAHDRGILHRDIKPDNVILAPGASPGEYLPRLTDFGLAKVAEDPGGETVSDTRAGTPAYMAPEQVAGRRGEVGPSSDIYAMGATLYEILTGRPPFRGETEAETLRLVLESHPVRPRSLRPGLPRDLETICLKCLRLEPARRYPTAAALRDDLQRFLQGRPIFGQPISTPDRAWRWARRRPGVTALIVLVFVLAGALAGGLAWWVTWLEWHHGRLQEQIALVAASDNEAQKQAQIAEHRRRLADRHRYAEGLRRARQALDARQTELAQGILHDLALDPEESGPRGFAWRYLWRRANREFATLWGHEAIVLGWSATPDARTLATWDLHGWVLIWDRSAPGAADRPLVVTPNIGPDLHSLRFFPDGRLLAAATGPTARPSIRVFRTATGEQVARLGIGARADVTDFGFDAQGRRLSAVVDRRNGSTELRNWNLDNPDAPPSIRPLDGHRERIRFSPDGRLLALSDDRGLALIDPRSGAVARVLDTERPGTPEFSADGAFVAANSGNRVRVWEVATGRDAAHHVLDDGGLIEYRLSPRGARLAVMDASGRVTVVDRTTARRRVLTSGPRRTLRGHLLSFSADESLLAINVALAPGGSQPPEVWDIEAARRVATFPGRPEHAEAAFFGDGRSLIVTGGIGPRIWPIDPTTLPDALDGHAAEAWAAAYSPDGRVLATGSDDHGEPRTIRLWNPTTGRMLAGWSAHTATVAALAFSPDGRLLASGSLDAGAPGHPNAILWDAATQQRLATLDGHTNRVRSVAFSPDGQTLATASDDHTARLWNVETRRLRAVLEGHARNLTSLAFRPDGQTLATASNDATIRLWDARTGRTRHILRDLGDVNALAFAPDGSILASANIDGGIKLWDPDTGFLIQTIRGEADQLRSLAFSPSGRNLAAAGKGKVVRIWDIVTGQELLTLDGHKAQINALAFAPDGSVLVSCDHDGAIRLWRDGPVDLLPPR